MKKHAREALAEANRVAAPLGCTVEWVGFTADVHYRFAVIRDGKELGRFSAASTPKRPAEVANWARQNTRRLMRAAGVGA